MNLEGKIHHLPNYVKGFIFAFLVALSFGYYTGVFFIKHTTEFTPKGVEENYNGNQLESDLSDDSWDSDEWNEEEEEQESLKYKKSEQAIISTVHTHAISFSLIFLSLGALLILTSIPIWLKKILIVEPFLSIILTFGGIWLMWKEIIWMKYVVMFSGMLLTLTFSLSVLIVILQLFKKKA